MITIDQQIEYVTRLRDSAKRQIDNEPGLPTRVRRQMEKDLRTVEATLETLTAAQEQAPDCD